MNTHADKEQPNKNKSAANAASHKQVSEESSTQLEDNQPEIITQRKLQESASNSPQVSQLQSFQDIANNSPQAKQMAQLQKPVDIHSAQQPIQKKENNTGLPDDLKSGIENLSGYSMDDVKVHYNSDKPAQLQAHAYAQGTDIHLGTGQEKHLPHEAWHVVQQKQGRVKPTLQMKDKVNINDDATLEKEADVMGKKAIQCSADKDFNEKNTNNAPSIELSTVQRSSSSSLRVLQAKNFPANQSPLGFDISYSVNPKSNSDVGRFQQTGSDVLQRLIVVDDDMDTSRLMAAVRIYYKHSDKERITTIHKAKDVDLEEGEKIYMVAHGTGDEHGGRSVEELAKILKTWKLHEKSNVIKLISCFSGKDAPELSYANMLALELDFMYKVTGVKGLEATDEQGHTRATEMLVDEDTFNKAYFETLEGDDSFEQAEKVTQALKVKIATCKFGEEVPLMVEAYEEVNKLCQGVFKKLEGALKGMIRDKNKRDSEDIMTPL